MKFNCAYDEIVEIHKLIPNPKNPNYLCSKDGKVFSSFTNRFIKARNRKDGYLDVCLQGKMHLVHRLVAECFLTGAGEVNHINGKKNDNRAENLEYVTRSQNILHSINILKNKHIANGDKNPNCKIKKADIDDVLEMYCTGESIDSIAEKYSVHRETVKNIMRRIPRCDIRYLKYKEVADAKIKNGRSARWK